MLLTCASAVLPPVWWPAVVPTRAPFAADVPARTRQDRIFISAACPL
jgi:hypothetical protein